LITSSIFDPSFSFSNRNMSSLSGLAASIRATTESDTYDLGGQNVSTITSTISSAFAEPFPLNEMIRLTFVTGAGKLGRARYDEGAAKAVTSSLRELGFEEDKGASCVVECGGCFKLQHDTGKNLKTVVVFPKITGGDGDDDADLADGVSGMAIHDDASPLTKNSPEYMIAVASPNVFPRMLASKCPSWAQKKGCLQALSAVEELVQGYEEKLMQGQALTDPEQEFFDSVADLSAKESLVKKEMANQVEAGKLTRLEIKTLLNQVTEKTLSLEEDISKAKEEKKPKRAEKLAEMKKKADARQKMIEGFTPQPPHRLKHAPEIAKLYAEMRPLLKLEDSAKGRLLTVKETTALARKDEIMEQVYQLEDSSRGWFEDDEAFSARIDASRAAARAMDKKKSSGKKSSSSGGGGGSGFKTKPINSWVTPGVKKKAPTKKAAKPSGGGVFAAMMIDSDSDSD